MVATGLGGVCRGPGRKDGKDGFGRLRLTQGGAYALLPQEARRARQRPEMIGSAPGWGEQHDDQVCRTFINGLKIRRLGQAGEPSDRPGKGLKARMRNGDPLAYAGRSQTLALQHRLMDQTRIQSERTGHHRRHFEQNLLAAMPARPRRNGLRQEEVGQAWRDASRKRPGRGHGQALSGTGEAERITLNSFY